MARIICVAREKRLGFPMALLFTIPNSHNGQRSFESFLGRDVSVAGSRFGDLPSYGGTCQISPRTGIHKDTQAAVWKTGGRMEVALGLCTWGWHPWENRRS